MRACHRRAVEVHFHTDGCQVHRNVSTDLQDSLFMTGIVIETNTTQIRNRSHSFSIKSTRMFRLLKNFSVFKFYPNWCCLTYCSNQRWHHLAETATWKTLRTMLRYNVHVATAKSSSKCGLQSRCLALSLEQWSFTGIAILSTWLLLTHQDRDEMFQWSRETLHNRSTPGIRVLCPTRWSIFAESMPLRMKLSE